MRRRLRRRRRKIEFTPTHHKTCLRAVNPHTRHARKHASRRDSENRSCYNFSTSMVPPSEHELRKQLSAEGFGHAYVWQDGPHAFYSDHTHAGLTAHIILE